jgi:adenylate kinase
MRVVIMGPPGAGKGTQAKRLAERFGLSHLSSGDILRAQKSSGSELGKKLRTYMDAGALVPDEVVVAIMAGAIAAQAKDGLLLDGFPRTLAQAQALDRQLEQLCLPLELVLVVDVPDEAVVERIVGRRSCPKCKRPYHVKYLRPRNDGRCDDCGLELQQRSDDTEETVKKRLAAYHAQTAPVIEYYTGAGRAPVVKVDGRGSPDEVTARLFEVLGAQAQRKRRGQATEVTARD